MKVRPKSTYRAKPTYSAHNADKVRAINPHKIDPTRLAKQRRTMLSQINKGFSRLRAALLKVVVDEDSFGLKDEKAHVSNTYDSFEDFLVNCGGIGSGVPGPCPRGIGPRLVNSLKSIGAKAGHIEHVVKQYVTDGIAHSVAKLPASVQPFVTGAFHVAKVGTAVAFATWRAGQAMAERVAIERGATPEQARRLRGVLSSLDVATAKPVVLALEVSHVGTGLIGAASMIPPATAAYLAYSTARNPLATMRAAKYAVSNTLKRARSSASLGPVGLSRDDLGHAIASALEAHDYDDLYIAILSAALDATQEIKKALAIAETAYDTSSKKDPLERATDAVDVLGFDPDEITVNAAWRFQSTEQQRQAFKHWLLTQIQAEIAGKTQEQIWRLFIEEGYKKGAARSFDDVKAKGGLKTGDGVPLRQRLDFAGQTKEDFLRTAFSQPVAVEKVQLLAGRAFDELEAISTDMSNRITRTLVDGLVQGQSPRDLGRDLANEVDISRARAETIARTEIVRAHAEGQLTALEQLGVEQVGVAIEWSTTGDDKVCELCEPLEGVVLKIDEARGMLPRHPNCRCAWIPANVGEDDDKQKDTKKEIDRALRQSGSGGDWGPGDLISRSRPESLVNSSEGRLVPTPLMLRNRLWNFLIGDSPDFDEHLYKLYGDVALPIHLKKLSDSIEEIYPIANCGGAGGTMGPCPKRGILTHSGERAFATFKEHLNSADHLTPEQKAKYEKAAYTVLSRMPDKATDAFMENVKSIQFHSSAQELGNALAQRYPALKPLLSKGATVNGSYDATDSSLNLDGGTVTRADVAGADRKNTHEVYAHEFMHAVEGSSYSHSSTPEWQAIHRAEFGTAEAPRLSTYATSKPAESWAEFGRLLYGTDMDRAVIERTFPRASHYLKSKGLWR